MWKILDRQSQTLVTMELCPTSGISTHVPGGYSPGVGRRKKYLRALKEEVRGGEEATEAENVFYLRYPEPYFDFRV